MRYFAFVTEDGYMLGATTSASGADRDYWYDADEHPDADIVVLDISDADRSAPIDAPPLNQLMHAPRTTLEMALADHGTSAQYWDDGYSAWQAVLQYAT